MKQTARIGIRVAAFAAAVVVAKLALILLGNHGVIDTSATPMQVIVLGAITGMTYGLLGVGLVLVYRSNRIINFAHGNIGAFGAAFFGVAAVKWHLPYWIAFLMSMALSALVGVGTEAAAVRRLRNAPLLMSVVVTLGIGQFLVLSTLSDLRWTHPTSVSGVKAFVAGLIPKVAPLSNQAMRLGRGEPLLWYPLVTTLLYTVAILLLLQVIARRSER